jgi:hypothetical protein
VAARRSQRQLVDPVVGSWRRYCRTEARRTAAEESWIIDPHGPLQPSEYTLTAKGHFHISYDHPAYEGCAALRRVAPRRGSNACVHGLRPCTVVTQDAGSSNDGAQNGQPPVVAHTGAAAERCPPAPPGAAAEHHGAGCMLGG